MAKNNNVGFAFPFRFSDEGKVATVGGVYSSPPTHEQEARAVNAGVVQLLLTAPNERVMLGQFGVGAQAWVFSLIQRTTFNMLALRVKEQMDWWIHRARLKRVNSALIPQTGKVYVDLKLEFKDTERESVVRVPLRMD